MSFGKRTRDERQTVPVSMADDDSKADNDWGGLPVWQRRMLMGTLAVLGAVSFVLLLGPEGRNALLGPAVAVPFEGETISFDLPVSGVSDDQSTVNLALRDACLHYPGEVAEGPSSSGEQIVWQKIDTASGRVTHSYRGGDDIIACLATKQMPRLCKPAEREKLAKMVNDYALAHDAFAARVKNMIDNPDAVASASSSAEMVPLSSEETDAIKKKTGIDLEFSQAILAAIKTVAQNGYLSSADFGAIPDPVKPYLVEALEHQCGQ